MLQTPVVLGLLESIGSSNPNTAGVCHTRSSAGPLVGGEPFVVEGLLLDEVLSGLVKHDSLELLPQERD